MVCHQLCFDNKVPTFPRSHGQCTWNECKIHGNNVLIGWKGIIVGDHPKF